MAWLKKVPTMLMGIDVTHPGPGSVKGAPSIAAVVASYEVDYAQYPASMEIQETKKEVPAISLLFNHRLFKICRWSQI
jgi:eukaryotic translation initiation factor 2C